MTSNGNVYAAFATAKLFTGATTPSPCRIGSGFTEVQSSRLKLTLPLPSVLKNNFKVVDGPPSSAVGNPGLKFVSIYIGSHFMNTVGHYVLNFSYKTSAEQLF